MNKLFHPATGVATAALVAASAAASAQSLDYTLVQALPGTLPDGESYDLLAGLPRFDGDSVALFDAGPTITPDGTPTNGFTELYLADAATPRQLATVVELGDAIPDAPGFEFLNFGGFRGPALLGGGDVAFYGFGTLNGEPITTSDDIAIGYYGSVGGTLVEYARVGNAYPTAGGGTNGTFGPLSGQGLTTSGADAYFIARNNGGATSDEAVFRGDAAGGATRVVGVGDVLDFGSPDGAVNVLDVNALYGGQDGAYAVELEVQTVTNTILTELTFVDYGDGLGLRPVVSPNDFGIGLLRGIDATDFPTVADDSGLLFTSREFPGSDPELRLLDVLTGLDRTILTQNDAYAFGANGDVILRFGDDDSLALNDGTVVVSVELGAAGTPTNERGTAVLFDDGSGQMPLLSSGDAFDGRTIDFVTLTPMGFNDGQALVLVGFTDMTAGIYLVAVPEPATAGLGLVGLGVLATRRHR